MSHTKKAMSVAFERWLPFAVIAVVVTGFAYVAVQQNHRMSANDPQIQIAEDVARAITSGEVPPQGVVSAQPTTEMEDSLSTFVVIYGATSTPIGSSVSLDGKLPTIPQGVLDVAKEKGENRVTWQPKPGVRIAAVITKFSGPEEGFVLAGRSLKEVDARIKQLCLMAGISLALALLLSYLVLFFFAKKEAGHHTVEHHSAE